MTEGRVVTYSQHVAVCVCGGVLLCVGWGGMGLSSSAVAVCVCGGVLLCVGWGWMGLSSSTMEAFLIALRIT